MIKFVGLKAKMYDLFSVSINYIYLLKYIRILCHTVPEKTLYTGLSVKIVRLFISD